jgi:hypothetical protein
VTKLRRGFVKESEEYAIEFRQELGLLESSPICARKLAEHLDVPVLMLSSHPTIPPDVKAYFRGKGNSSFSAVTLADQAFRQIVYNDYQHPNRHSSSIMHEIAHILLRHPARPPFQKDACRDFDPIKEKEANELGFAILVPKPAALLAVESFGDRKAAADYFGVSVTLLNYRIRKTNAEGWSFNRRRRSAGK